MHIYKSEVDTWFYAVVVSILIFPFIMAVVEVIVWPGILICGLTAAFMIWLCVSTKYVITEDALIIHAGLYKVNIPRSSITSVTESSDVTASPAFSLDRLEIKYGAGKTILISPKDKTEFLADLDLPAR